MAVLTATELDIALRRIAASVAVVTWRKSQAKLAFQALEDWFEGSGRGILGGVIETASPGTFNAAQKTAIVKQYLLQKFERGG